MQTDNHLPGKHLPQAGSIIRAVDQLGMRLRAVREARGVQQNKVAGLPKGYLSKLETGVETNPTLEVLERLSTAYRFRNVAEFLAALHDALNDQTKTDLKFPEKNAQTPPRDEPLTEEGGGDGNDSRVSAADLKQIREGSSILAQAFAGLTARLDRTLRKTTTPRASQPRRVAGRRGSHR